MLPYTIPYTQGKTSLITSIMYGHESNTQAITELVRLISNYYNYTLSIYSVYCQSRLMLGIHAHEQKIDTTHKLSLVTPIMTLWYILTVNFDVKLHTILLIR